MGVQGLVSIIIITHNRCELLKKCISSVIESAANVNKEIIVWDNNSDKETIEYLEEVEKQFPFLKVIYNKENIGVNAKRKVFDLSKGGYMIGVDDDVIKFPDEWIQKMMNAFRSVDRLGYLSLDVVKDEFTNGAKPPESEYIEINYGNGLTLQFGPVGGWCFMIPRYVCKKVGKLRQCKKIIFFAEDSDYIIRAEMKSFKSAILKDVKCYHATGEYYNKDYKEVLDKKMQDWYASDKDFHKFVRKIRYSIYKFFKH